MKKSEIKQMIREVIQEELDPIKEAFALLLRESMNLNNQKSKRTPTLKNVSSSKKQSSRSPIKNILEQTRQEIEMGVSKPIQYEQKQPDIMMTSADAMGFGMMRNQSPIEFNPQSVDDLKLQKKLKQVQESGNEEVVNRIKTVEDNIFNKDYSKILSKSIEKSKQKRG